MQFLDQLQCPQWIRRAGDLHVAGVGQHALQKPDVGGLVVDNDDSKVVDRHDWMATAACFAIKDSTSSLKRCTLIGLVRYSSAPASFSLRIWRRVASALRITTLVSRKAGSARSCLRTRSPPTSGRWTLRRTRSGWWCLASSRPTWPCMAVRSFTRG